MPPKYDPCVVEARLRDYLTVLLPEELQWAYRFAAALQIDVQFKWKWLYGYWLRVRYTWSCAQGSNKISIQY